MLPGEIIGGKYVVERVIGEGGMGTVVAARHRASNMPVAVKVLRPFTGDHTTDETHTRRFLREVRGASQLAGEHVARVYDWGRHYDGRPFLVMELLDGPDLDTVLGAGLLPPRLATSYIIQACKGLAAAHALGIVHRDIKPANLMLSRGPNGDSIIKVVDFGIATAARNDRHDDDITAAHIVIGSITYMSPEQMRSAHDLDARSDVWSLGVTLYELLTGRVPFDGENFAAMAVSIATDDHAPLHEVDPGLAAIIGRCLAKDPDDRYASVDALAAALAPYAETRPAPTFDHTVRMHVPARVLHGAETVVAQRDSILDWPPRPPAHETPPRPKRRSSRRSSYLAIAAAAVVLLGLGLGGAIGGSGDLQAANASLTASPSTNANANLTVEPIEPEVAPEEAEPIDLSQLPSAPDAKPAPARELAKRAYRRAAKRPVARKAGVRIKVSSSCDRHDRRCGL